MVSDVQCSSCGGQKIVKGIPLRLSAEAGKVGLNCKAGLLLGTEGLLADLCEDCGTVRLYVKDTSRKWYLK